MCPLLWPNNRFLYFPPREILDLPLSSVMYLFNLLPIEFFFFYCIYFAVKQPLPPGVDFLTEEPTPAPPLLSPLTGRKSE